MSERADRPNHPGAAGNRGETIARRAAAVLLTMYALSLVSHVWTQLRYGSWLYAWFEGLWFVAVYLAACAGLWSGREWGRRMATALAALPTAVIPLVFLAAGMPHNNLWFLARVLRGVACAAALALLLRSRSAAPGTNGRRGLPPALTAFGIEAVILAVAGALGYQRLWGMLELTQMPGARMLTAMGYCCGISPDLIITDYDVGPWGAITLAGLPILAVANTVGLIPFVLLARRIRRRLARPAAPAPEIAA